MYIRGVTGGFPGWGGASGYTHGRDGISGSKPGLGLTRRAGRDLPFRFGGLAGAEGVGDAPFAGAAAQRGGIEAAEGEFDLVPDVADDAVRLGAEIGDRRWRKNRRRRLFIQGCERFRGCFREKRASRW